MALIETAKFPDGIATDADLCTTPYSPPQMSLPAPACRRQGRQGGERKARGGGLRFLDVSAGREQA